MCHWLVRADEKNILKNKQKNRQCQWQYKFIILCFVGHCLCYILMDNVPLFYFKYDKKINIANFCNVLMQNNKK